MGRDGGTDTLDGRIVELIEAGVMAGAYAALAKTMPEAERGLMKMSLKHHARVGALCGEIGIRAATGARAAAALPSPENRRPRA